MAIKRWILSSMNRMNGIVGRSDLPRRLRSPSAGAPDGKAPREPSLRGGPAGRESAGGPAHLGAYAPLVSAIRDELEHFVASQLRLHLAIAERDRYLLTSIEVECTDGGDGAELLRRFSHEFTPEQIKRFLARDIIASLPNASSIDLSQFGGLNAARAHADVSDEGGDYADLVAQLRADTPSGGARAFDVTLFGRWTDSEPAPGPVPRVHAPATPLPGPRIEIAIEDADGSREVALASVVPNRRYAIGKGDGCDIRVKGAFASRRHCEVWLDGGAWWAADAGSTNGIRVETAAGVLGRAGTPAGAPKAPIEIKPGARIVLSALAQGSAADYPRITLRLAPSVHAPATPLAPAPRRATTPVTPIVAPGVKPALELWAEMATGQRSIALDNHPMPLRVGRSRGQDLVVDWTHEGVSGHHVDIASVEATGAEVIVHGDNGVTVGDVTHRAGDRFRWQVGERMTLGRASGDEPECVLWLAPSR